MTDRGLLAMQYPTLAKALLLRIIVQVYLLAGCGPSAEERKRLEEKQRTDLLASEEKQRMERLASAEKVFHDQVTLNMSVAAITSPSADDDSQWERDTGWGGGLFSSKPQTQSLFALVYISPSLVDAAVDLWAMNRKDIDDNDKERARNQILDQFVRPGERAFLLLVKPIGEDGSSNWWRLRLGDDLFQNITITTIDGTMGRVIRYEKSLDQELGVDHGIVSCLFYVQDVVDENKDPLFNVSISNLSYSIRPDIGAGTNKANSSVSWIRSASTFQTYFQFETSKVHVLKMVQANIPFEDIERRYVKPSRVVLTSKISENALNILIQLAASRFMKVAFK